MALPVAGVIDAVKDAWDVFMFFYKPTYAGEPFEAVPFIYTSGTYSYTSQQGVTYTDQPAYLEYCDGWFSVSGMGHGNFVVTASSGDFRIGYYTPGVQAYTTFTANGDSYFSVGRSVADYPSYSVADVTKVYVNRRSTSPFSWSGAISDPFIAFMVDGFGVTNISGNTGVANAAPNIVPLQPGSVYVYDEALDIYIDFWREKYPDWDLTADDFPTQEDYLPTDPTEPTEPVDLFSFLTKDQLEDVLTSESYHLQPFPTSQVFDFSSIEVPTETIPIQYLELFPKVFSISWDYFSSLGLATPLLIFGFLFLLIRILRGR